MLLKTLVTAVMHSPSHAVVVERLATRTNRMFKRVALIIVEERR